MSYDNEKPQIDVMHTCDAQQAQQVLQKMLVGTVLTAMHYSAGFSLEYSREGKAPGPFTPMVVRLTLRSAWWMGTQASWQILLSNNPCTALTSDAEEPMRAFALMCLYGTQIIQVHLDSDGTLHLKTAHGAELHLPGQEDVFEESWIVDVPRDVPHNELWSVICTGQGEIFCRYPVADMC